MHHYIFVNLLMSLRTMRIVFDYPFIVENKIVSTYRAKHKFFKTYWPYIHPTSCISIKKNCFEELLNVISDKDFTDIWLDLRICLYSKYILKDFQKIFLIVFQDF